MPSAGDFLSFLALGGRRPPLARRLTDPGHRVPRQSRIVLRGGTPNLP